MTGSLQCVVLDCPDVTVLASFYQAVLGGIVNQPDPAGRQARTSRRCTRRAGRLGVPAGPNFVAPRWPDPTHPQQLHLDIDVPKPDEAHELVVGLGARLLRASRAAGGSTQTRPGIRSA